MKPVIEFLELNGFFKMKSKTTCYGNDKIEVWIYEDHYAVGSNEEGWRYSENHNIYWLIGTLTYNGFMDKNYKQL